MGIVFLQRVADTTNNLNSNRNKIKEHVFFFLKVFIVNKDIEKKRIFAQTTRMFF